MKKPCSQSGFIMVLVLMVTALVVVLATYMMNKTMVFSPMAQATIEGEKAQQLALGGIQLAMSQLAYADAKGKEDQKPQQPGAQQQPQLGGDPKAKQLLESLLPVLNQWQSFTFDKAKDGFEGTLKICLMSEDGKINLNEIYDFNKHAFIGKQEEIKSVLKVIFEAIKKNNGGDISFEAFEKFLKGRQSKLRDVTELITIQGFETFNNYIFYEPSDIKQSDAEKKRPLYVTDLFTLWSQNATIDPWLMSTSLMTSFGLKLPEMAGKEPKEKVAGLLKTFKPNNTWPADWNTNFAKMYSKEFNALPKGIQSLLSTSFTANTFSALSYATVGKITKRFFAIIEREKAESSQVKPPLGQIQQQPKQEKQLPARVILKKLYWI